MSIPDKEPLDVCGDCRARASHGVVMHILTKPRGWWAVCDSCMRRSMRDAAEGRERAAKRLARLEGRDRKTHLKKRVGSHQDEAPAYQDEIFEWNEAVG